MRIFFLSKVIGDLLEGTIIDYKILKLFYFFIFF